MIYMLKMSLYGLKQATRQWYKKFNFSVVGHGYTKTAAEYCVYLREFHDCNFIILLLYIDNM